MCTCYCQSIASLDETTRIILFIKSETLSKVKKGSGNFTSISEAISSIPERTSPSKHFFLIYIMEGFISRICHHWWWEEEIFGGDWWNTWWLYLNLGCIQFLFTSYCCTKLVNVICFFMSIKWITVDFFEK